MKITSCKECKFAVYNGDRQTGCLLQKLALFQKLDMVKEAYDKDKEFYLIGCKCPWSRTTNWAKTKKYGINLVDEVKKEMAPQYHLIFPFIDEAQLREMIEVALHQKYPPNTITVLDFYNESVLITKILREYRINKWRLQSLVKGTRLRSAIDIAIDKINLPLYFYTHQLNPYFSEKLDQTLNNLEQFIVYYNSEGYLISTKVHRELSGHFGGSLVQRCKNRAQNLTLNLDLINV